MLVIVINVEEQPLFLKNGMKLILLKLTLILILIPVLILTSMMIYHFKVDFKL